MMKRYVHLAILLCGFYANMHAESCPDNKASVVADQANPTTAKIGSEDFWLCSYKGKKCYYHKTKSGNHYKLYNANNESDSNCPDKIF